MYEYLKTVAFPPILTSEFSPDKDFLYLLLRNFHNIKILHAWKSQFKLPWHFQVFYDYGNPVECSQMSGS